MRDHDACPHCGDCTGTHECVVESEAVWQPERHVTPPCPRRPTRRLRTLADVVAWLEGDGWYRAKVAGLHVEVYLSGGTWKWRVNRNPETSGVGLLGWGSGARDECKHAAVRFATRRQQCQTDATSSNTASSVTAPSAADRR